MRRLAAILLLALTAGATLTSVPAAAQIQDRYCLQGKRWGYPGNCLFSTYQQCMATASGTPDYCGINPAYAYARDRHGRTIAVGRIDLIGALAGWEGVAQDQLVNTGSRYVHVPGNIRGRWRWSGRSAPTEAGHITGAGKARIFTSDHTPQVGGVFGLTSDLKRVEQCRVYREATYHARIDDIDRYFA